MFLLWAIYAVTSTSTSHQVQRDTSLFVYDDPVNRLHVRQHGDTVWQTVKGRTVRVIDDGARLSFMVEENGRSTSEDFVIREDRLFYASGKKAQVSMPVANLRMIRDAVELVRRQETSLRKVPQQ